jgi:hypothetical protein
LFRKKILHLSSQNWKGVNCLAAVGEAGGEILFRLYFLNSVRIVIPVVEDKGPLVAAGVSGALQQGFGGVLFYYVVGLVVPRFV